MRPSWVGPRTAVAGLVLANAVPLVGVVALGWGLHSLLVVYWLESAVVGVESVAKILLAEGSESDEESSMKLNGKPVSALGEAVNLLIAAFFVVHYGLFWVVHGAFVLSFPAIFPGLAPASPPVVGAAVVGLVAYHGVSFWGNYIGEREYRHTSPGTLMTEPYRRVLVLHLTVVLGAFVVASIGAPIGALVVMVLVKTALDLRGHWQEHDRARKRSPTAAAE